MDPNIPFVSATGSWPTRTLADPVHSVARPVVKAPDVRATHIVLPTVVP